MTPDPEQAALLLACVRGALGVCGPGEITAAAARNRDWPAFLDLAFEHGVHVIAADCLLQSQIEIPRETQRQLEAVLTGNARRVFLLSNELIALTGCLERAGIACAALKGPAVAHTCYAEPFHRAIGDLDLLVSECDVDKSLALLAEAGYIEQGNDHARLCRRRFRRWNNEMPLRNEGTGICVDLHWELTPPGFPSYLRGREVMNRAVEIEIQGAGVKSLAPEDNLIYLCGHAAKHGWSDLLWLVDICGLLRKIGSPAGQSLAVPVCRTGVDLAETILAEPMPVWPIREAHPDESLHDRVADLYRQTNRRGTVLKAMAIQLFAPQPADWESVEFTERFLWMYYPWRLLRLAWKWSRTWPGAGPAKPGKIEEQHGAEQRAETAG